jgi:hypothetical protein
MASEGLRHPSDGAVL